MLYCLGSTVCALHADCKALTEGLQVTPNVKPHRLAFVHIPKTGGTSIEVSVASNLARNGARARCTPPELCCAALSKSMCTMR